MMNSVISIKSLASIFSKNKHSRTEREKSVNTCIRGHRFRVNLEFGSWFRYDWQGDSQKAASINWK